MIDGHARVGPEPASLERLKAEMSRAGVGRAVLFGPDPWRYLPETARGGAFAFVRRIDPLDDHSLAQSEALTTGHYAGVELRPARPGRWLNARQVAPLWEKLARLNLPVNIAIASQQYNEFSDVVTAFPDLRIVIDDLGRAGETAVSQYLPILLEYARYPQVYVSVSRLSDVSLEEHPHRDLWPVLRETLDRFGAQRLVWGSGYPEVMDGCGYLAEAQLLEQLPFLTSDDLRLITEANAAGLWFPSRAASAESEPGALTREAAEPRSG